MNNKRYTLEDAPDYIYLQNNAIVYQSIFEKGFDGDFKLLLSIIEDNTDVGESIDWSMVFDEYKAKLQTP